MIVTAIVLALLSQAGGGDRGHRRPSSAPEDSCIRSTRARNGSPGKLPDIWKLPVIR
jgi:hypothetical protein